MCAGSPEFVHECDVPRVWGRGGGGAGAHAGALAQRALATLPRVPGR